MVSSTSIILSNKRAHSWPFIYTVVNIMLVIGNLKRTEALSLVFLKMTLVFCIAIINFHKIIFRKNSTTSNYFLRFFLNTQRLPAFHIKQINETGEPFRIFITNRKTSIELLQDNSLDKENQIIW